MHLKGIEEDATKKTTKKSRVPLDALCLQSTAQERMKATLIMQHINTKYNYFLMHREKERKRSEMKHGIEK